MSKTLAELKAEHAAVYAQFQPHLRDYSKLAADVLKLQVDIIRESFKTTLSKTPVEKVLIVKIGARETLANVERAFETLKDAAILEVVYDPAKFEFSVWGKP